MYKELINKSRESSEQTRHRIRLMCKKLENTGGVPEEMQNYLNYLEA